MAEAGGSSSTRHIADQSSLHIEQLSSGTPVAPADTLSIMAAPPAIDFTTLPSPPTSWADPMPWSRATRPVVVDRVDSSGEEADESEDKEDDLGADLWLSTSDARYESQPIPIRVGQIPDIRTFYAHKEILVKSKWFDRALSGGFREAEEQAIDLPEEVPSIFHFVIAFLYEQRYVPVQSAAEALVPVENKGKGREESIGDDDIDSDNSTATSSSTSTDSRVPAVLHPQEPGVKTRGLHRADCRCIHCTSIDGTSLRPCERCGFQRNHEPLRNLHSRNVQNAPRPPFLNRNVAEKVSHPSARISTDDMRTWLLIYELNLDVYTCAVRLLMDDLQAAVSRATVDMLETAGTEAAQIPVLRLCAKLYANVPETDPLLHMILARLGFLQSLLWQKTPVETSEFLISHPDLAAMMLRETSRRHDNEDKYRILPAMEFGSKPVGVMRRYEGRPPRNYMA